MFFLLESACHSRGWGQASCQRALSCGGPRYFSPWWQCPLEQTGWDASSWVVPEGCRHCGAQGLCILLAAHSPAVGDASRLQEKQKGKIRPCVILPMLKRAIQPLKGAISLQGHFITCTSGLALQLMQGLAKSTQIKGN